MSTNNSVNNGLSSATGTGNFVGSNSPVLVTPTLGAASATSLSFSSTSGIIGTTTNNNAAAGSVGEYVESAIGSGSYTTSTVAQNFASMSLTAGDWDVYSTVFSTTAATILPVLTLSSISTVSNTIQGPGLGYTYYDLVPDKTGCSSGYRRLSLSGTTTIYLTGSMTWSGGTAPTYTNAQIGARRVR